MKNFERHDRLLDLFGDPVETLWSFVFEMGFIFFLRASQQIMSLDRASESNVMAVRICMGIPFLLLITMIYYGPQSDMRVKTLARRNSPEFSMLNFERRDRLLALLGYPLEKIWLFVFAMGFIFILSASQQIMSLDQASKSKFITISLCQGIPYAIPSVLIYYGPPTYILVKHYGHLNFRCASLSNFKCLDILWASIKMLSQMSWLIEFARGLLVQFRLSR